LRFIAPERNGRRGNPVLWPRRYFDELLALQGDQGARALLKQYSANVMLVTIDDDAIFTDVDTPEELASISGQTTSGVCR
jgi:molybdenum cofactor cytidylyltransferase